MSEPSKWAGTAGDTSGQKAQITGRERMEKGEARVLVATGKKATAELTRVTACV